MDPLDYDGHTPLFLALRGGHEACAEQLLEIGASLDVVSKVSQPIIRYVLQLLEWDTRFHLAISQRLSLVINKMPIMHSVRNF